MEDVKLVAESLQDFDKIDEGIGDFFAGAKSAISLALKNPNDEDKVNSAVKTAFARQFGKYPKIKDTILGWELQKKIELLKLAAKRLEDKKIGSLSVVKKDGKILVVGVPLEGGATTSTGVR